MSEVTIPKEDLRQVSIYPKRFYHVYRDNPDGTKRAIEMVEISKRGTMNPQGVPKRWKNDVSPVEREILQPYYDAWKKGEGAPIVGTPLDAWVADPEMVQTLNQAHIRSVEDFARLEDHYLVKLGIPGGREKQKRAQAFLETQKDLSKVSTEITELREKNEALMEQVNDLKGVIERHAIKEHEKEATAPIPKRRGRPPKNQEAIN